jgi:hypothetical protein
MATWNQITENLGSQLTNALKRRRVELFVRTLNLGPKDRILDLGSEDGSYLSRYYPYPGNIVLADIELAPMQAGVQRYGLAGCVLLPQNGPFPMDDQEFDAVWCNSVIEHVTVSRKECEVADHGSFCARADEHQRRFAAEIERVGRSYFVQTPNLHFPIESHSWLPFIQYLGQPQRQLLARKTSRYWVKQWRADFHLFNIQRLREHFPSATAYLTERAFGLPKSLIAVRKRAGQPA